MPASAFTERQRGKIKGLFLLQLSTILESADTNLITTVPFCTRAVQQAINQYSKVTLLKALKKTLSSHYSMLFAAPEAVSREFNIRERTGLKQ